LARLYFTNPINQSENLKPNRITTKIIVGCRAGKIKNSKKIIAASFYICFFPLAKKPDAAQSQNKKDRRKNTPWRITLKRKDYKSLLKLIIAVFLRK